MAKEKKAEIDITAEAESHLRVLLRGMESADGFLELRSFNEKDKGGYADSMFVPLVDVQSGDLNGVVNWARRQSKMGRGVFAGVNPRSEENGSKASVKQMTTTFLDLDLEKRGISREDALAEINEISPLPPDLITDSGGGLHVLYFNKPTDDYDKWRDLQETLYNKFEHLGADRSVVTDSSRILRLTPFPNWKYNKDDGGRKTGIVHFTAREFIPSIETVSEVFDVRSGIGAATKGSSKLPEAIPEGGSIGGEGRNNMLFKEASRLRNRNYGFDELYATISAINERRASPPLPDEEVRRIVESAMRYQPTKDITEGVGLANLFSSDAGDFIGEPGRVGYKFSEFVRTAFPELIPIIHGLHSGELGMINAVPNVGKDQPLHSKIKMSDGTWKTMGEMVVGDHIASVDGNANYVYGVFPQGERDVYRLTFSDGRTAEAGAEHLWKVHYRGWPTARIFSTTDLKIQLESMGEKNRMWIETVSGDFGNTINLPIPAWSLGVLLGDGGLTQGTPRITSKDPEIFGRLRVELDAFGVVPQRIDALSKSLSTKVNGAGSNGLTNALRELGLMGADSSTKFIPKKYLSSDKETRLELMRGLMDTDGHVGKNKTMDYTTVSRQLALDVQELARSLGAVAKITERTPSYGGLNGRKKLGKVAYTVRIRHKDGYEFVRLPRKKVRLADRSDRNARLTLQSVEYVGKMPTQCIAVTHPSKLYVTDDYIVTHNTTLGLGLSMSVATGKEYYPLFAGGRPKKVMYLDFENRASFLQRDVMTMAGMNFGEVERDLIGDNLYISVDQEIYGSAMSLSNPDHLEIVSREAINHGAELIIIDTMAAAFQLSNENDNSEAEKVVIKPLKELAKKSGAAILVVHHVGKAGETGDRSKLYAGRGASAYAAAARMVLLLEHLKDGSGKRVDNHVVLSQPKIKGKPFDDTVFELDFGRRWFEPADIVLPDDTATQDLIWSVVTEPMRRIEVIAILKEAGHDISDSTVDRALKLGLKTGRLMKGAVAGQYVPRPTAESEAASGDVILTSDLDEVLDSDVIGEGEAE